jgi:hypothetical protein
MAFIKLKIFLTAERNLFMMLLATIVTMLFSTPCFSATPDEEIVLTFSHPAVGQYYITAVYSGNSVYLPAMELFNLIYIHYQKGSSGHSLQGTWLTNDNPWQIDATTLKASFGKENFTLTAGDFRIGELDLYLSPALFERMFGLRFTINMSALSVSLQSDKPLPVEEKKQHEQLRAQLQRQKEEAKDFPLIYPRKRMIAGAGMADYNLGIYADGSGVSGLYTLTGGMELFGGDIQGTAYGEAGRSSQPMKASNVNWRYAFTENPYLTSVRAGQINTTGLLYQRIIGGAVSNDPIEPRKVYNTYSIDGNTTPDSEVEIYINNQLTDYTRADELGYYRFSFSLTYGTVRINLRIYTPSGEIITEERQLQIPFTFLPKGIVSYNIQGGAVDDGINDISLNNYALHGDVAYGLTNTITAKAGTDYMSYNVKPVYYGSLSTRVFDQYLLNIDVAPNAFYRTTATVTYASSRNFSLNYIRFDNDSLYNPKKAKQEVDASAYMPFKVFGLQSGIRLGGETYFFKGNSLTNYNLDLSTRIGRFNIRSNYRDQLAASSLKTSFGLGLVTGSVTYTFSRTPGIPVFVKGMFLRAQAQYDVHNKQMFTAGLQFSRTVFQKGRFNINIDRYMDAKSTRIQAGFILDLNAVRAYTQYTSSGKNQAFQQTFNGSVALDSKSAKLTASNREQVGRAAVSVLMFVDSNNNHKYDAGEEKVAVRSLRLSESATMELGKDSILRITQLQSYWRYNAEIVQSALPNATLAPAVTQFSFIADPNRYKRIEIPLYHTGVIEGNVKLLRDGNEEGIGGVRLLLKSGGLTKDETIRTFSDGGYYAMNLIPGKYTLEADPTQLTFLDATSKPDKLEFEVKALAEGDYIGNLDLLLVTEKPAISDTTKQKEEILISSDTLQKPVIVKPVIRKDTAVMIVHKVTQELVTISEDIFAIQLGAFRVKSNAEALRSKLQTLLGRKVDIITEDNFYKVRINDIKDQKEADEIIEVLKKNGITELWLISMKAKQRMVIVEKQDTVTTISTAEEISVQLGAFRRRANAIKLQAQLEAEMKYKTIIVDEDGYFKVRVLGLPIIKQTILDEMKKLDSPIQRLKIKDVWVLPVKTKPEEIPPAAVREVVSATKITGKKEFPHLAAIDSTLNLIATRIVTPVIPPEPEFSIQVGSFIKRSDALRAQKRISAKFKREVEIVQQYEYYYLIIPGFYTRRETFPFYPELAGMGYNKVSVINRK